MARGTVWCARDKDRERGTVHAMIMAHTAVPDRLSAGLFNKSANYGKYISSISTHLRRNPFHRQRNRRHRRRSFFVNLMSRRCYSRSPSFSRVYVSVLRTANGVAFEFSKGKTKRFCGNKCHTHVYDTESVAARQQICCWAEEKRTLITIVDWVVIVIVVLLFHMTRRSLRAREHIGREFALMKWRE